ncbi:MAG: hypothetical protein PSN34_03750 [Urechidicola sp.]|nr:hypothetical protein [Urechidicola sp.]
MKKLENYGVQELSMVEKKEKEGGFLIALWVWASNATNGEVIFHHQL